MKSDALCIWAGTNCTFQDMVAEVNTLSSDEASKEYQFGVQGMVAQLPRRVSPNMRTTITMMETSVVIYNASAGSGGGLESSFQQVFQGFDRPTWFVMFAIYLALVAVGYCISVTFRKTFSPFVALMHLQGADGPLFENENEEVDKEDIVFQVHPKIRRMHELSIALLYSSFFIMGVVVVVFYEVCFYFSDVNFFKYVVLRIYYILTYSSMIHSLA